MESVSLIIPAFNEERQIESTLEQVLGTMASFLCLEIIVVDDGSTDGTLAQCRAVVARHPELVRVHALPANRGKGWALRTGSSLARYPVVVFYDADGEIPSEEIIRLVNLRARTHAAAVVGRKLFLPEEVPPGRALISTIFRRLCRFFWPFLPDTQTGLKVFDRAALLEVLPAVRTDRFLFDLELLILLGRRTALTEVPIMYRWGREKGRIGAKALATCLREFAAIVRRHVGLGQRRRGREKRPSKGGRTPWPAHILFLSWRDHTHPAAGGAEVYTREVATALARKGYRITWFSAAYPGAPPVEHSEGVCHIRRGSRFTVYPWAFFYYLKTRLEGIAFDVIVDQVNTMGFAAPLWCPRKSILMIHQLARDVWHHELPGLAGRIGYRLEPLFLRLYRRTPAITVGRDTRDDLLGLSFRGPFWIAENGVQPVQVSVPKATQPELVFLGRLDARSKRLDDALAVFRLVRQAFPAARLHIIGRTSGTGLPPEEGVHHLGYVPNDRRDAILAAAWLLLATSVREGWGRMVLEAAAAGTPAAVYDVPGLREAVVDGVTGLVTPEDPRAMASRVIDLLGSPDRLAEMGVNARKRAGLYTWDSTVAKWELAVDKVRHLRPERMPLGDSVAAAIRSLAFSRRRTLEF